MKVLWTSRPALFVECMMFVTAYRQTWFGDSYNGGLFIGEIDYKIDVVSRFERPEVVIWKSRI
jgi:hypothetical protein